MGVALLLTAGIMLYAAGYAGDPHARTFLDRQGRFIGTLDRAPQGLQIFTPLERIPPLLIHRTIASEDRFFRWHRGINPFSLCSALIDNLSAGRVVRGGSTISQQLARNLIQAREGKATRRSLFNKAREGMLAIGLELIRGKAWILERYLNAIPYGRRAYGVAAASRVYFDREPPELTAGQIEALVGLPKAPGRRGAALAKTGGAPNDLAGRHFTEFVERERHAAREAPIVRTTLDLDLQRRVEAAIREVLSQRAAGDPRLTAAAVVIDVRTGDLIAMAGSRDYRDDAIDGKVNAAVALRQPGSTLKPFTSFAAFAKGFGPDSIVPDEPLAFTASGAEEEEAYAPQNFDRRFHGRITMRRALANSYNIPAVATLNDIGLSFYHELLRGFGFTTFVKPPPHYGLAVTLGAGEVTLLELTNAYAALARAGRFLPVRLLAADPHASPRGVLDGAERFAAMVTEILADPAARLPAFGFNASMEVEGHPVAVKTGTSYEHRDTWTVGYTPSFAVGVWVGHADGSPLPAASAVSGATSAAPVWHAIMEALLRGRPAEPFPRVAMPGPEGPAPAIMATEAPEGGPLRVISPLPHSTYRMHAWLPAEHQLIPASAVVAPGAGARLRWQLDGELLAVTDGPRPKVFLEPQPGGHLLTIESDDGALREIPFRVLAPDAVAALEER